MVRTVGVSFTLIGAVAAMVACRDLTGPEENEKDGKFSIGNGGSFVTTGGASGELNDITFIVDLFTQRMSFNAKGSPASGVFNFTGRVLGVNTHFHGDILCYSLSGNRARVAGMITNSDPAVFEGQEAMWYVEDNGEGSSFVPDRISFFETGTAGAGTAFCAAAVLPDPTMYPIETGNVQVHF